MNFNSEISNFQLDMKKLGVKKWSRKIPPESAPNEVLEFCDEPVKKSSISVCNPFRAKSFDQKSYIVYEYFLTYIFGQSWRNVHSYVKTIFEPEKNNKIFLETVLIQILFFAES